MIYSREFIADLLGIRLSKVSTDKSYRRSTECYEIKIVYYASLKDNPSKIDLFDKVNFMDHMDKLANGELGNYIIYEYVIQIYTKHYPNKDVLKDHILLRIESTKNKLNLMFKDQISEEFNYHFEDVK